MHGVLFGAYIPLHVSSKYTGSMAVYSEIEILLKM
jgi:hypothetical protein